MPGLHTHNSNAAVVQDTLSQQVQPLVSTSDASHGSKFALSMGDSMTVHDNKQLTGC